MASNTLLDVVLATVRHRLDQLTNPVFSREVVEALMAEIQRLRPFERNHSLELRAELENRVDELAEENEELQDHNEALHAAMSQHKSIIAQQATRIACLQEELNAAVMGREPAHLSQGLPLPKWLNGPNGGPAQQALKAAALRLSQAKRFGAVRGANGLVLERFSNRPANLRTGFGAVGDQVEPAKAGQGCPAADGARRGVVDQGPAVGQGRERSPGGAGGWSLGSSAEITMTHTDIERTRTDHVDS